jgi:hypothetical protein
MRRMNRHRVAGIVLILAAGVFLSVGALTDPPNVLQLVAGGALLVAGLVRLARSRAPGGR